MSEPKSIELSTRLTRADAAGVIEALIEGLKEGALSIQKSTDSLEMPVPRVIDLDIRATLDEEKAGMVLEVSWRTNRPDIPDTPDNDLTELDGGKGRKK